MPEPSLERLQAMVRRVLDEQATQGRDPHEVKLRLGNIGRGLAGARRETLGVQRDQQKMR